MNDLTAYQVIQVGLGLLGVLLAILYWPLVKRLEKAEKAHSDIKDALAEFKLAVATNYTTNASTKDQFEKQEKTYNEILAYFKTKHDQ